MKAELLANYTQNHAQNARKFLYKCHFLVENLHVNLLFSTRTAGKSLLGLEYRRATGKITLSAFSCNHTHFFRQQVFSLSMHMQSCMKTACKHICEFHMV